METLPPWGTSKRRRLELRRMQEALHDRVRRTTPQLRPEINCPVAASDPVRLKGEGVKSDGTLAACCDVTADKVMDDDSSTHPPGKTTFQPPRRTSVPSERLELLHWSPDDLLSTVTYLVHRRAPTDGFARRRVSTKRSIVGEPEPKKEADQEIPANHGPGGWRGRRRGKDFYWWVMATLTGLQRREVAQLTTSNWKATTQATRDSWGRFADRVKQKGWQCHVIALEGNSAAKPLSPTKASCCKPADDVVASGFGVLLVYPVLLSSDHVQALRFLRGAPSRSTWSRTLSELPYFQRVIDECMRHMQRVGARYNLPLVACSLEHDASEARATFLHLSVYMGREVRVGKIAVTSAKTSILRADVQWGTVAPISVRPTRAKDGQSEPMNTEIVREYYRVARAKKTQVLCRTSAALYKDAETSRTESSVTVVQCCTHA